MGNLRRLKTKKPVPTFSRTIGFGLIVGTLATVTAIIFSLGN